MRTRVLCLAAALIVGWPGPPSRAADPLRDEASQGLRKAVEFFRTKVATEGGYLWRYSDDLAKREGEGKASATQAWVQPPGTPSIGLAFLDAYKATGDAYYLEGARDTARVLIMGQLRSGGWTYSVDFDPKMRPKLAYRIDGGPAKARNYTTLDDNTTQAALRLMMRTDQALQFKDEKIHEATRFALSSVLKAQYPNGAWPQGYDHFPDSAQFPVKKASYPETWSRTAIKQDYWYFYTFNDGVLADVIDVLLEADSIYKEPEFRKAVDRAGAFILLAQMPEPQPAWAQQYNFDMQPTWARRFEPPSITGGESQGILRTLLRLYRETGDKKYLEPVPRAVEYLKRSLLPNGQLARFYELKTNKPLYFTKDDYQLTYKDDNLPTHYGFKVSATLDRIAQEYQQVRKLDPTELKKPAGTSKPSVSSGLTAQVKTVLAAQDPRGAWVDEGKLRYHGGSDPTSRIIDCQTFIKNVGILSNYLAATKP